MSSSSSVSSSYSSPQLLRSPENDIIDAISKAASDMAGQMNNWAQGEYAKTSDVTNQTVNNFLQTSQKMSGFADGLTDQYNNLFAPENKQLIEDANTYASENRLRNDMGAAGARAAQAGKAAVDNSTEALQKYGIDPSSGRYAALDKASAVQNAANIVGAQNQQRQADIQTGQQLRSQAVQVGAQLPGAIANARNTAIQANTGASNASLANANTGVNLNSLADKYLNTAMQVKLPQVGTTSMSSSVGNSSGGGDGGGGGGRSSGGGGGGGGGGDSSSPGTTWDDPSNYTQDNASTGGSYNGYQPDSSIQNYGDGGGGGGGDSSVFDTGSGVDMSDYGSYGFAAGGAIPEPGQTPGGQVPPQASPSGGQQTDDVPANLTADEFVIPRDVALWKGQEFFQKLIAQSRMANVKAAAHGQRAQPGQPDPAATQQPAFQSRPQMGA